MAKIVIVLDSADSIDQLNSTLNLDATKPKAGLVNVRNLLDAILGGARVCASGYVVTRGTDPNVGTNGTDSVKTSWTSGLD